MLYNLNLPVIQSAGKKDLSKLQLGSEQEERRLCTSAQGEDAWRLSRGTQARSEFLGIFIPSFFLFHHLSNPLLSHAHGAAAWELQGATEAAAFPHSPVCPCRESRQGNTHSPSGSPHRTEARISCITQRALGSNPHFKPHISGTQVPSELTAQIREWLGHPAAMGGVLGKSQQMEIWYLQMLIFSCLLSFFGFFLKQVCLSPHPSTHYPHWGLEQCKDFFLISLFHCM